MTRAAFKAINWRMWAALPPSVVALVVRVDGKVGTIGRPELPPGVCTACGCTEHDACVTRTVTEGGIDYTSCAWRDASKTRCTACPPVSAERAIHRAAARQSVRIA